MLNDVLHTGIARRYSTISLTGRGGKTTQLCTPWPSCLQLVVIQHPTGLGLGENKEISLLTAHMYWLLRQWVCLKRRRKFFFDKLVAYITPKHTNNTITQHVLFHPIMLHHSSKSYMIVHVLLLVGYYCAGFILYCHNIFPPLWCVMTELVTMWQNWHGCACCYI